MIELSNGHRFEYMAASGALAFDGKGWPWEWPLRWLGILDPTLFTVVIKTLTFKPRKGNLRWYNPFGCIRLIKEGTVNSVGLTNKGYEWWCEEIGPKISGEIPLVGSIFTEDPDETFKMSLALGEFSLKGLVLNASCPNTESGVFNDTERIIECCKAAKKATALPLILKVSVVHDIEGIIFGIERIIEAISINSVPWDIVFPDKKSPLAHLGGGGVSGRIAQLHTWGFVERIVKETRIPVIGPSVWDFEDIERLRKLGSKAISFGAVFLPYPWRPTTFVRRDRKQSVPAPASQKGE